MGVAPVPIAERTPTARAAAEQASRYYPVYLDLRGRRVVVVGGGPVAAQRVAELLPTGAEIVVVAREVESAIEELAAAGELVWHRRGYQPADLIGAFLLLAADSPAVNTRAAREAQRRGVLVNVADDPAHCDLITPAVVRRGGLTVAVSTGGRSPAFARYVRERLEAIIGEEYGELLATVAEVRQEMFRRGQRVSPERWQAALHEAVAEYQSGHGLVGAQERLRRVLGAALSVCPAPWKAPRR